jgi:hypothetical protein
VEELLARISSRELTAWEAYERVTGPIGAERADRHAALVAAVIANAMSDKGGYTIDDFLPQWDPDAPKPEQSPQDMVRAVREANRALGGGVT